MPAMLAACCRIGGVTASSGIRFDGAIGSDVVLLEVDGRAGKYGTLRANGPLEVNRGGRMGRRGSDRPGVRGGGHRRHRRLPARAAPGVGTRRRSVLS